MTLQKLKSLFLFLLLGAFCLSCALTKQVLSVETLGEDSFIDKRDGEKYKTVKIGEQVWMAENLRYDVPGVCTVWPNSVDTIITIDSCIAYGRLYDWATMMAGSSFTDADSSMVQGICPEGWHIPSDSEWKELEMELGMCGTDLNGAGWRGSDQGVHLKSKRAWLSDSLSSNRSGFSALPAGCCNNGRFYASGETADFWTATAYSSSLAWSRRLYYNYGKVSRGANDKVNGFSCRCLKD